MFRTLSPKYLAVCMLCGPMKGDSIDGGYDECMTGIQAHFSTYHSGNVSLKNWPPPPHSRTAAGVTWYRDNRGNEIFGIAPMSTR